MTDEQDDITRELVEEGMLTVIVVTVVAAIALGGIVVMGWLSA